VFCRVTVARGRAAAAAVAAVHLAARGEGVRRPARAVVPLMSGGCRVGDVTLVIGVA
jgi:hypothetical protein